MPTSCPRQGASGGSATTSSPTSREARPVRMSDITSCDVRTPDGRSLGRVRDLVLVMDGPVRGAHAAMRVDAVLVGGSSVAVRLGYERGGVRGPAPLSTLLRWLERRAHVVP